MACPLRLPTRGLRIGLLDSRCGNLLGDMEVRLDTTARACVIMMQ